MLKLKRHKKNPLISPGEEQWQKEGTFNPSPVQKDDNTYLLFRALSEEKDHEGERLQVSTIGKAKSSDGVGFENKEKFIEPEQDWERYGCEDPRVTEISGKYYITYTALSTYPFRPEGIKVGVAVSNDLQSIEKRGLATTFNSKAMAFFPKRVKGELAAVLTVHTDKPPAKIALATFDREDQIWSPEYWENWYSRLNEKLIPLLRSEEDHLEVGAAPVKTEQGWLLLHSYIRNYMSAPEFGVEAALLDLDNPRKVIARTEEPVLVAEADYEMKGQVPGVVFPSGALVEDNELQLYYGAADTHCCLATCDLDELISSMETEEKLWTFSEVGKEASFERFDNNPLLEPRPEFDWETKAVFNPAAVELDDKVHLLYRAMSQERTSVLGYAQSDDGFHIDERSSEPVYEPRKDFEKKKNKGNSGCEDPRLTKIGDELFMTYTAFDGKSPTRVALSTIDVDDFINQEWNWSEPQLISPPGVDDKNSCIIRNSDHYVVFHRIYPCIWIDYVDDLNFEGKDKWIKGRAVVKPRPEKWDSRKVGIAAPPLEIEAGLLLLYHASGDDKKYRVGAVLLQKGNPMQVKARTEKPLLEPEAEYEKKGMVQNVVFPCGAIERDGEVLIYYGGGDDVVAGARMKLKDLLAQFKKE